MPDSVNLGTISAGISLRLSPFQRDQIKALLLIRELNAELSTVDGKSITISINTQKTIAGAQSMAKGVSDASKTATRSLMSDFDRQVQASFRANQISAQDYKQYLGSRLSQYEAYSAAWTSLNKELVSVDKAGADEMAANAQRIANMQIASAKEAAAEMVSIDRKATADRIAAVQLLEQAQAGQGRAAVLVAQQSAFAARVAADEQASAAAHVATMAKLSKGPSTASQRLGSVATGMLYGGGATLLAAGMVAKQAADINMSLAQIRNNTVVTDAEWNKFLNDGKKLSEAWGVPLIQIAEGFKTTKDLGFQAAAAFKIVSAGIGLAKATGTDAGDLTGTLAQVMHVYKIPGDQAKETLNGIKTALNMGRGTLTDFIGGLNQVLGLAAGLKVSLPDLLSMLATFSRQGLPYDEAATQIRGSILRVEHPTAGQQKGLQALSEAYNKLHKNHIDLVHDFSEEGVAQRTLVGVTRDLAAATHGHASEIYTVMPAYRGAVGQILLTTAGFKDLNTIQGAVAGGLKRTTEIQEAENRILGQNKLAIDKLATAWQNFILNFGNSKALGEVADDLRAILDAFNRLSPATQSAILKTTLWAGALLLAAGAIEKLPFGGLLGNISKIAPAFAEAGGGVKGFSAGAVALLGRGGAYGLVIAGILLDIGLIKRDWDAATDAMQNYASAKAGNDKTQAGFSKLAQSTNPRIALEGSIYGASASMDKIDAEIALLKQVQAGKITPGMAGGQLFPKRTWQELVGIGPGDQYANKASDPDWVTDRLTRLQSSRNALASDQARNVAMLKSLNADFQNKVGQGVTGLGEHIKATCALWASSFLKQMGVNIPSIASAHGLEQWVQKHGGKQVSLADAQMGDVIVWHGKKYGAIQPNGQRSQYHVGIAQGGGMVEQSSDGKVTTVPIYDTGHASAFRLPGSGAGSSTTLDNATAALFQKLLKGDKPRKLTRQDRAGFELIGMGGNDKFSSERAKALAHFKEELAEGVRYSTAHLIYLKKLEDIDKQEIAYKQKKADADQKANDAFLAHQMTAAIQQQASINSDMIRGGEALSTIYPLISKGKVGPLQPIMGLGTGDTAGLFPYAGEKVPKPPKPLTDDVDIATDREIEQATRASRLDPGDLNANYQAKLAEIQDQATAYLAQAKLTLADLDAFLKAGKPAQMPGMSDEQMKRLAGVSDYENAAKLAADRDYNDQKRQMTDETMRFEAEHNMISQAQYRAYLQQQLADTKKFADAQDTILNPVWEQYASALQDSMKKATSQTAQAFKDLGDGIARAFNDAFDQAESRGNKSGSFWKVFGRDLQKDLQEALVGQADKLIQTGWNDIIGKIFKPKTTQTSLGAPGQAAATGSPVAVAQSVLAAITGGKGTVTPISPTTSTVAMMRVGTLIVENGGGSAHPVGIPGAPGGSTGAHSSVSTANMGQYLAAAGMVASLAAMPAKKRSHSLLGGLLGGIAGSLIPGLGWLAGAQSGIGFGGAFASGGIAPANKLSFVGHGRELGMPVIPGVPMRVFSNGQTEQIMAGARRQSAMGGVRDININVHHHGNINGGQDVKDMYDNSASIVAKRFQVARPDFTIS